MPSATVIANDLFFFWSGIVAKGVSLAAACGGVIQRTPRRGKGVLITAAAGVWCFLNEPIVMMLQALFWLEIISTLVKHAFFFFFFASDTMLEIHL